MWGLNPRSRIPVWNIWVSFLGFYVKQALECAHTHARRVLITVWTCITTENSDNTIPQTLFHTCEPPDGRMNSPVFLGHLLISNILPDSPDFYIFLPYSPDFYMFTSHMCNLHHVYLGQGSKMQTVVFWILYTVQKSFILTSNFVLTTLYTHPGLIISHLVDDYLNIC